MFGLRHILINPNPSLSLGKTLGQDFHQKVATPCWPNPSSWLCQYLCFIFSVMRLHILFSLGCSEASPDHFSAGLFWVLLSSVFWSYRTVLPHCPVLAPRTSTTSLQDLPPPHTTHSPRREIQITFFKTSIEKMWIQMFFSFLRGRSNKSVGFRKQTWNITISPQWFSSLDSIC